MPLVKVARYTVRGPMGGRVQILRHIEGPQKWRVDVRVRKGDQVDEHTIKSPDRIPLGAMREVVFKSIAEMLQKDEAVNDAEMTFFIEARR